MALEIEKLPCYYRTQANTFPISRALKLCVKKYF